MKAVLGECVCMGGGGSGGEIRTRMPASLDLSMAKSDLSWSFLRPAAFLWWMHCATTWLVALQSTTFNGGFRVEWSRAKQANQLSPAFQSSLRQAEFDPHLRPEDTPPYINKLPVIHEILQNRSNRSRLFRFVADAPTTTLQRIKGITTGGLPTFVDVGESFASSAIGEDSILNQLHRLGRRAVMMGDDTWVGLFPGSFSRAFPYPSFNVRDLNTLDSAVHKIIDSEMARDDWDVLIAHYLGVDHAGHRYHPGHAAMGVKLTEMNGEIAAAVARLPEDAVLLVFGDHGMTSGGDHGGDSPNELHAALFVYSGGPEFAERHGHSDTLSRTTVAQIDFAPTISMLLGLPIPFGSIGRVISELVVSTDGADRITVERSNAEQVRRYLEVYVQQHQELAAVWTKLEHLFAEAKTADSTESANISDLKHSRRVGDLYVKYIDQVQEACRAVWTTFDDRSMIAGIMMLATSIGLQLRHLQARGGTWSHMPSKSWIALSVSIAGAIFPLLGTFSNSFVVHQDKIVSGLLVSLMIVLAIQAAAARCFRASGLFLACAAFNRAAHISFACREEQHGCNVWNMGTREALFAMATLGAVLYEWHSREALLDVNVTRQRLYSTIPFVCATIVIHWNLDDVDETLHSVGPTDSEHASAGIPPALQAIPWLDAIFTFAGSSKIRLLPAQITFILLAIDMLRLWHFPSYVEITTAPAPVEDSVTKPERVVYLHGVTSAISAPFVALISNLSLALMLLLDKKSVPGAALTILQVCAFLWARRELRPKMPVLVAAVGWVLITMSGFYVTGHQPTFSGIQWGSGLIGLPDSHNIISGAMITYNTFGIYILMAIGLPLLVIWVPVDSWSSPESVRKVGEFWCHSKGRDEFCKQLDSAVLLHQLYFAAAAFISCCAAALHRRHLMVWKIFAPRVVFDCVALLVGSTAVLFGQFFLYRLTALLDRADAAVEQLAAEARRSKQAATPLK